MRRKFGAAARRRIAQAEFISAEHFKKYWALRKRSFRGNGRTVGSGVVIEIDE